MDEVKNVNSSKLQGNLNNPKIESLSAGHSPVLPELA
jgi:hypothetical protein